MRLSATVLVTLAFVISSAADEPAVPVKYVPGLRDSSVDVPLPMAVVASADTVAVVGAKFTIFIAITNHSSAPLEKLSLFAKMTEGFQHPEGDHIGADLPTIASGETKMFRIPLTAAAGGKHFVEWRVTTTQGHEIVNRQTATIKYDDAER